jgi:hypothetical protein
MVLLNVEAKQESQLMLSAEVTREEYVKVIER